MGSIISSQNRDHDKRKRTKLEEELRDMEHRLRVTATSHYQSAEYYKKLNDKVQCLSWIAGTLGTSGGVISKLAWESIVKRLPRGGPVLAAVSFTSVLFTVFVRMPNVPYLPDTLHTEHFRAGIECQHLNRRVKFMADTKVWDLEISWGELAADYIKLLADKKEVNSRIQTEEWAYFKALEKIKERNKLKRERTLFINRGPCDNSGDS